MEHSLVSYEIPSIQVQIKINWRILKIFIDIVSCWLLNRVIPSTQVTTIHGVTLLLYFEPCEFFFECRANASTWESTSPLSVSFAVSICIESSLSSSLSRRNHFVTSVYLRFFYRCQCRVIIQRLIEKMSISKQEIELFISTHLYDKINGSRFATIDFKFRVISAGVSILFYLLEREKDFGRTDVSCLKRLDVTLAMTHDKAVGINHLIAQWVKFTLWHRGIYVLSTIFYIKLLFSNVCDRDFSNTANFC